MGPMKLYFDVRDIFRAPRLALSGKKIFIFTVATLIGYVAFWLLAYIAMAASGMGFYEAWQQYGLYPFLGCATLSLFGKILYWIGTLVLFYAVSLGCTAVARVTYKQLKGDEFYSAGDALKYLKKHWHPVIFTWLSFVLIIFLFLIGAVFFALFGYIPYIGEFLFALPYLLYFFGSLFTLYTAVVFLISFIYTPAIVAAYEEDTMGAVFQSYSITWSQPWRILLYHLVLLPIAAIGYYLFELFWFASYKFINIVFGMGWVKSVFGLEWFTSGKLAQIATWAWNTVNPFTCDVTKTCCGSTVHTCSDWTFCSWFDMGSTTQVASLSGTEYVAGFIIAVFLFLLILSVIGYVLSIFSVGEVLMFVIFKKKTDDDNLLERKDEEELEEEDDDEDDLLSDNDDDDSSDDKSAEEDTTDDSTSETETDSSDEKNESDKD
ncbi:MAG: hypothetical protein ACE5D8_00955 [Fidelibacterota bacterium]